MLFPTFTFAAFFAVVLPVSWALKRFPTPWKLFVLGASYWFYAAWDRRFVLLLVAMTLVNAAAARMNRRFTHPGARRATLAVAVVFDLGVLAFFKYYGFFTQSLESSFGISSPALSIVLPIGISFFTFQAISYAVDVHRGETDPAPLLDFAVYLSFFPQLVAGPIVRAREFLPQMRFPRRARHRSSGSGRRELEEPVQLELWSDRGLDRIELGRAAQLIGRGMFKKVVVADFLAGAIVDEAFASPGSYGAVDVLFGVYGYAVQIYADFSGYTDMAIGVALLMGFRFPQNFDRPYAAVSIQDFWRRWHMTLSRWLRDYLYIPLGGNRRGRVRTYVNLLVTMGLGGLWHGAAGVFVVWGLYHGVGLAAERLAGQLWPARTSTGSAPDAGSALGDWLRVLAVFHFVCAGWVLFNSETLAHAGDVFERLLSGWGTGTELLTPTVLAVIVGSVLAQYVPLDFAERWSKRAAAVPSAVTAAAFAVWTMIVVALGPEGVADYIYFQF
ncbi:MAG: MBOAT family protein [Acidimicrobiaceae bacterium]|nr:MBOAT family protein [Acidimicrobiaceae bacterium]MYG99132.1 MBOAT family protein [Acidimicrobiaceae bacterium]MYL03495.1 MBOAT family protein [Acidimicrobiaceae bacterium]